MVEPYALVGGSAAALLFHTLQIYIFTTAPERLHHPPGAVAVSRQSSGFPLRLDQSSFGYLFFYIILHAYQVI